MRYDLPWGSPLRYLWFGGLGFTVPPFLCSPLPEKAAASPLAFDYGPVPRRCAGRGGRYRPSTKETAKPIFQVKISLFLS